MTISEDEVEVRTPDGVADAVLFHRPETDQPAVVFLPDGIGTRPSQRDMARRIAAEGYDVLLPNIYYRTSKAPFFEWKPDFSEERTVTRFRELTGPLTAEAMERDGAAFADFFGDRAAGVVGFCFTGAMALRTAAARPDRIRAAASFHGGRLLEHAGVLPRVKARLYFGHAREDRTMPADAIAELEQALARWGGAYESETYDARHGWTVPDSAAYDEQAERAFAKLSALFAESLR